MMRALHEMSLAPTSFLPLGATPHRFTLERPQAKTPSTPNVADLFQIGCYIVRPQWRKLKYRDAASGYVS